MRNYIYFVLFILPSKFTSVNCAKLTDLSVRHIVRHKCSSTYEERNSAHEEHARALFPDIKITTEGRKFLGSFIGTQEATDLFVKEKIKEWEKDLMALAKIAEY